MMHVPERYCSSVIESLLRRKSEAEIESRISSSWGINVQFFFFYSTQCNFSSTDSCSGLCLLTLSLIMNDWWDKACIGSLRRILLYNMIYWCPWWHQWRTWTNVTACALKRAPIQQVSCINCPSLPPCILMVVDGKQVEAISQINEGIISQ